MENDKKLPRTVHLASILGGAITVIILVVCNTKAFEEASFTVFWALLVCFVGGITAEIYLLLSAVNDIVHKGQKEKKT